LLRLDGFLPVPQCLQGAGAGIPGKGPGVADLCCVWQGLQLRRQSGPFLHGVVAEAPRAEMTHEHGARMQGPCGVESAGQGEGLPKGVAGGGVLAKG
jgi:hypothetical protein